MYMDDIISFDLINWNRISVHPVTRTWGPRRRLLQLRDQRRGWRPQQARQNRLSHVDQQQVVADTGAPGDTHPYPLQRMFLRQLKTGFQYFLCKLF